MAWSTGWNAVNERRELTAQAESTQQVAVEHASSLAERLPARSSALWAVPTSAKVAFSVAYLSNAAARLETDGSAD